MYQRTVLDNGLRIVTSTVPHIHSVCISIFVGAGSRYETAEQAGISHFVEHVLFKGTEHRATAKELSEAIEGVGGVLNGGTDKELTVYWAKVARPYLRLALDVLADILRHSKFDPEEIEKERQVIIEEINSAMDSPHQRVNMLIDEVIWPDQPLGRDVAGSKETVSKITRQMLLEYLAHQYLPNNTVVAVAGNINHDEVVTEVTRLLGDWRDGIPGNWFPARENLDGPHLLSEPRDTEQTQLCLALPGLPHDHPDRFVVDLLNIILGEGMSSRLFLELRERRGLAYDIHSYVSHFFDSGSLIIYAGVDPKNVEAAIEVILAQILLLKEEEVPESELAKAKDMGKGRLLLRMEDTKNVAGWLGGQELLMGKIQTVDEVLSIVDTITSADLKRVSQNLFQTNRLNLAVVGPCPKEEKLYQLLKL